MVADINLLQKGKTLMFKHVLTVTLLIISASVRKFTGNVSD